MIRISLFKGDDGFYGFDVIGHANYDVKGKDIVCAAVSILSFTTVRSLISVVGIEKDDLKYSVKDGNMSLRLKVRPNDSTELLFSFFLEGIRSLVDEYRKFIMYEIKEESC